MTENDDGKYTSSIRFSFYSRSLFLCWRPPLEPSMKSFFLFQWQPIWKVEWKMVIANVIYLFISRHPKQIGSGVLDAVWKNTTFTVDKEVLFNFLIKEFICFVDEKKIKIYRYVCILSEKTYGFDLLCICFYNVSDLETHKFCEFPTSTVTKK